jgi:beta-phosphoglucomutase-like phosphatase (HAD superfamily)
MTERKYEAIIFDIDGTLIDSLDVWQMLIDNFCLKMELNIVLKYQQLKAMHFVSASQFFIDEF